MTTPLTNGQHGGMLSKAWALGLAVALLLATASFLANATIAQGREISALQANDRSRERELNEVKRALEGINQKLDRILEQGR